MVCGDTDEKQKAYEYTMSLNLDSHKAYCEKHGYDYFCLRNLLDIGIDRSNSEDIRGYTWYKIRVIQKLLKDNYDYVLWVDCDSHFNNYDLTIEMLSTTMGTQHCMLFHLLNELTLHIQAGVFLVKNTPFTDTLLNFIWDTDVKANQMEQFMINYHYTRDPDFYKYICLFPEGSTTMQSIPGVNENKNSLLFHYPGDYRHRMPTVSSSEKKRIAVCTMILGDTEGEQARYEAKMSLNLKSHKTYCDKHGYDYVCLRSLLDIGIDLSKSDDVRAYTCYKLKLIQKLLKDGYDYVLWVDSDSHFNNYDMRIETIAAAMGTDSCMLFDVLRDPVISLHIQAGVFLVRNIPFTNTLLNFIWDTYTESEFGEQHTINNHYVNDPTFHKYITLTKEYKPLLQSVPGINESKDTLLFHYPCKFRHMMPTSLEMPTLTPAPVPAPAQTQEPTQAQRLSHIAAITSERDPTIWAPISSQRWSHMAAITIPSPVPVPTQEHVPAAPDQSAQDPTVWVYK